MKNFLFLLVILCWSPQIFAQHTGASPVNGAVIPAFPKDFTGKWAGELYIYAAKGLVQTVPMQLHILPINDTTFTYTIIYGEDLEAGMRDYLLRKGSQGDHHWVIDEQDGILLDNFYLGGVLHGPFTVMGSHLNSSLEKRGELLLYTIGSGATDAVRTSGTTVEEGGEEESIEVQSFEVKNFQRAWLWPMKE